jgi:hypothetical protein
MGNDGRLDALLIALMTLHRVDVAVSPPIDPAVRDGIVADLHDPALIDALIDVAVEGCKEVVQRTASRDGVSFDMALQRYAVGAAIASEWSS